MCTYQILQQQLRVDTTTTDATAVVRAMSEYAAVRSGALQGAVLHAKQAVRTYSVRYVE